LKTEVAKNYPMEHDDSHEDYITWLKILQKYKKACGIREPLLKYRLSNQGKSGNKLQSARMTFMVYRYLGFGILKSCYYFASYALHGVWKYYGFSGKEHKKTTENQRR
jgi:teichuronic acid biosynthesis glycosyltransferase TuaG